MGNSAEHMVIGALAGIGIYDLFCRLTDQEFEWQKGLACAGIGSFCGLLPDIIEPATSPMHRQTAHSALVLFGLVLGQKYVLDRQDIPEDKRLLLSSIIAGYGSHLLLDATTPAGLPAT